MHIVMLAAPPLGVPDILPALGLLPHRVDVVPPDPAELLTRAAADVVMVDGRTDLAHARTTCRLLQATGLSLPLIVVLTEGGMAVVSTQWGVTDFVSDAAAPAEIEARLRLAARPAEAGLPLADGDEPIRNGDLVIDASAYTVRAGEELLDLTYKEFELLKFLAQHPGRVFTRAQLLQEVWGYDYYGGTRTVDVHVRRLRAKLGPEFESVIGTVRSVGYRFDPIAQLDEVGADGDIEGLGQAARVGAGVGAPARARVGVQAGVQGAELEAESGNPAKVS